MRNRLIKIMLLLLLFQGCKAQKEISSNLKEANHVILGEWRVSREENKKEGDVLIEVWRRPSYDFPISRFRDKWEFMDDGHLQYNIPGPTDKPETKKGSWALKAEEDKLMLIINKETGSFTFEVVSLKVDLLALKEL